MGRVFGAYSDISWSSKNECKDGNGNSFVFSLRDDFNFVKLKCLDKSKEVYHNENLLTAIGNEASGFCL